MWYKLRICADQGRTMFAGAFSCRFACQSALHINFAVCALRAPIPIRCRADQRRPAYRTSAWTSGRAIEHWDKDSGVAKDCCEFFGQERLADIEILCARQSHASGNSSCSPVFTFVVIARPAFEQTVCSDSAYDSRVLLHFWT